MSLKGRQISERCWLVRKAENLPYEQDGHQFKCVFNIETILINFNLFCLFKINANGFPKLKLMSENTLVFSLHSCTQCTQYTCSDAQSVNLVIDKSV